MFFIKITLCFPGINKYWNIYRKKEIWISYKCFHNLPTSSNWNFIRKNREHRKKTEAKKRHIEIKKKIGWIPKMLLVNVPKHFKISYEISFPLQCDLFNSSPTNGAANTGNKSLMPQLTRRQSHTPFSGNLCCPAAHPQHKPLPSHSHLPPMLTSHPWQTKTDSLEVSHTGPWLSVP